MLLADFANEIITRRIVARYRIPRNTVFRLSLSTPSTPFVQCYIIAYLTSSNSRFASFQGSMNSKYHTYPH